MEDARDMRLGRGSVMAKLDEKFLVVLEVGNKRVFASALDWPGWCVPGRDEAAGLQALVDMGPRYAEMLKGKRLGYKAPKTVATLKVVERQKGNATTDFGAPNLAAKAEARPVSAAELKRYEKIIAACFASLAGAAEAAQGQALSKGPRGGGRELGEIVRHVLEAQQGYLATLGWKFKHPGPLNQIAAIAPVGAAVVEGLGAAVRGETEKIGPRGGQRWAPRYFVRRSLWHVTDHLLEIEKRAVATDGLRQNG